MSRLGNMLVKGDGDVSKSPPSYCQAKQKLKIALGTGENADDCMTI